MRNAISRRTSRRKTAAAQAAALQARIQAADAAPERQVFYTGKGTASWSFPAGYGPALTYGCERFVMFPEVRLAFRLRAWNNGPQVFQERPSPVPYPSPDEVLQAGYGIYGAVPASYGNRLFGVRAGIGAAL